MYLPPANEVWGKVMFLLASVILSTGGGGLCVMSLPVWLPGPMFLPGGVSVSGPMFLLGIRCFWSHVPSGGSLSRGVSLTKNPRQRPPPNRDPLSQYGKERVVRILLECILTRVNFLTGFPLDLENLEK